MKRHLLLLAVFAAASTTASAQEGLSGLLLRFFSPSNPVVLRQNAVPAFDHSAHFVSQAGAQATLNEINQAIATQLSTVPVASSSAAFAFTFDPSLGVYERVTESFGPSYAERSLTGGKGKWSVGANSLHSTYDTLDEKTLDAGEIGFNLLHIDVAPPDKTNLNPWFEGDLIHSSLYMTIENDTTVTFVNYGVTDRFDLSLAIPYVRLDIDARIAAHIDHVATSTGPVVHAFDNGTDDADYFERGSASGIGDVLLRGKLDFHRGAKLGAAALVEFRLPTGKEEDLLGSGQTQTRLALIASGSKARFSPHVNLGYTMAFGESSVVDLPNQLDYVAGFDTALHKRVSISGDILGRTLFDSSQVTDVTKTYQFDTFQDPTVRSVQRTETTVTNGNVNTLVGVVGIKINPVGRLLITGNVLFKLNDAGLQDSVTPVFGLDYSF